MAGRLDNVLTM